MDYLRILINPNEGFTQRRLFPRDLFFVEDVVVRDLNIVIELRVEIQPRVAFF